MKAVVLAAGKGERLWPLTETRPKPLLPLANKPILQNTLEGLVEAGIRQVVVVVNYMGETIRQKLGDGSSLNCEIEYVKQRSPRGTADAVGVANSAIQTEDRFVVVYGDDYYDRQGLKDFVAKARQNEGATMATSKVDDASGFGLIEERNALIMSIKEKPLRRMAGLVNSGLYILTSSVFSSIKRTGPSKRGELELTDSLRMLISQGEYLHSTVLERGQWLGISYPWDLLDANQLAVMAEKTRTIRGKIEEGAHLDGPIVVEEGSVVKQGSRIEGPVHVGRNCEIGPNAYVRPFSSLGDNVKVGAACEVKNSIVMTKARIPHLSYIGDSILGEACSLGAGTITANLRFDEASVRSRVRSALVDSGRRKLGAIFGDEVKTGINVSVFPGVKIGAKAWLGPGAIIEKDVASSARQSA